MNAEAPRISGERVIEGSIVVFIASASVLLAREASRKRARRLEVEAMEQSAGDGNHVTTLEEVKLRLG